MIIQQVKQWFALRANSAQWAEVREWAQEKRARFSVGRDGRGCVIDQVRVAGVAARIEWGPSQRAYIPGNELRIRCELKLNPDLQMMVMARSLVEQLEKSVFEAYTDTLRTRAETDTPEEVRWLVMFSKFNELSARALRDGFSAFGVKREFVAVWMEAGLGAALIAATSSHLPAERPFVLLTQRGNVYLRVAMNRLSLGEIQAFWELFTVAATEAKRVHERLAGGGPWPQLGPTFLGGQSQLPE